MASIGPGSAWACSEFWSPPIDASRIVLHARRRPAFDPPAARRARASSTNWRSLLPPNCSPRPLRLTGNNLQDWQAEVAKQPAPPGANAGAWQRACALRTVVGNSPAALGRQLLGRIVRLFARTADDASSGDCGCCSEIAAVSDDWGDGNDATNLVTRFELLGEQLIRQQYRDPLVGVDGAVLRAPIWSAGQLFDADGMRSPGPNCCNWSTRTSPSKCCAPWPGCG